MMVSLEKSIDSGMNIRVMDEIFRTCTCTPLIFIIITHVHVKTVVVFLVELMCNLYFVLYSKQLFSLGFNRLVRVLKKKKKNHNVPESKQIPSKILPRIAV